MTPSTTADAGSSSSCTATAAGHSDPLYRARRTLHTGADLLTDRQVDRLTDRQVDRLTVLFKVEEHVEVEATWGHLSATQSRRTATRTAAGRKELMAALIDSISTRRARASWWRSPSSAAP